MASFTFPHCFQSSEGNGILPIHLLTLCSAINQDFWAWNFLNHLSLKVPSGFPVDLLFFKQCPFGCTSWGCVCTCAFLTSDFCQLCLQVHSCALDTRGHPSPLQFHLSHLQLEMEHCAVHLASHPACYTCRSFILYLIDFITSCYFAQFVLLRVWDSPSPFFFAGCGPLLIFLGLWPTALSSDYTQDPRLQTLPDLH